MELKVTKRMREVAPVLCEHIDDLRKKRQLELVRINYLKSVNKVDDVAEVEQRIRAIDAKIAPLHAEAKQKMLEGLSESLMTDAIVLQNVSKDMEIVGDSLAKENTRHYEAVAKLVSEHHDRNSMVRAVAIALEETAGELAEADTEQSDAPGAALPKGEVQAKPLALGAAGSSTDTKCPHCSTICKGAKGVASHQRFCKNKPAPGAEASTAVATDQGAKDAVGAQCPYCPKTFDSERASLPAIQFRRS